MIPKFSDLVASDRFSELPAEDKQAVASSYWDDFTAQNPGMEDYADQGRDLSSAYVTARQKADYAAPVEKRLLEAQARDAAFGLAVREGVLEGAISQDDLPRVLAGAQDRNAEKLRSLFDPKVDEEMQPAWQALQQKAFEAGVFGARPVEATMEDLNVGKRLQRGLGTRKAEDTAEYEQLREQLSSDFGLTADEVDDVVKHRLGLQEKDVSRDAFGTPHIKPTLLAKGEDAVRSGIESSDLPQPVKDKILGNLGERMQDFRERTVARVEEQMPELREALVAAGELRAEGTTEEKFQDITKWLNDNIISQGLTGLTAGVASTAEQLQKLDELGPEFMRMWRPKVVEPLFKAVDYDPVQRQKALGDFLALSTEFNKDSVDIFGTDASVYGQGVWSVAESVALGRVTGGVSVFSPSQISKFGPGMKATAEILNKGVAVSPQAGLAAAKSSTQTYRQALESGMSEDRASDMALRTGAIEFFTTALFSGVGRGGMEEVGQQLNRQAVKGAAKGATKSFGRRVLGGVTEEALEELTITALDTLAVQAKLDPSMTTEDFQRALRDTLVVTIATSGPAVAAGEFAQRKAAVESSALAVQAKEKGADTSGDAALEVPIETPPADRAGLDQPAQIETPITPTPETPVETGKPVELPAIHYSRTPFEPSATFDVSQVEGRYEEESVFGPGFYAMEPSDEQMWRDMGRFSLGKNRNEVVIRPKNPLVISPETADSIDIKGLVEKIRSGEDIGHDAVIVRGFGDADAERSIFERINELWTPEFEEGQTDGNYLNVEEYQAAEDQAIREVTGLSSETWNALSRAGFNQNQTFVPTAKVPDVVQTTTPTPEPTVEAPLPEQAQPTQAPSPQEPTGPLPEGTAPPETGAAEGGLTAEGEAPLGSLENPIEIQGDGQTLSPDSDGKLFTNTNNLSFNVAVQSHKGGRRTKVMVNESEDNYEIHFSVDGERGTTGEGAFVVSQRLLPILEKIVEASHRRDPNRAFRIAANSEKKLRVFSAALKRAGYTVTEDGNFFYAKSDPRSSPTTPTPQTNEVRQEQEQQVRPQEGQQEVRPEGLQGREDEVRPQGQEVTPETPAPLATGETGGGLTAGGDVATIGQDDRATVEGGVTGSREGARPGQPQPQGAEVARPPQEAAQGPAEGVGGLATGERVAPTGQGEVLGELGVAGRGDGRAGGSTGSTTVGDVAPAVAGPEGRAFREQVRKEAEDAGKAHWREILSSGQGAVPYRSGGGQYIVTRSSKPGVMFQITRTNAKGEPLGDEEIRTKEDYQRVLNDPEYLDAATEAVRPDIAQAVQGTMAIPEFDKPYIYNYRLKYRDVGPGTAPEGFVSAEGRNVSYDRPLSAQELYDFEIEPVGATEVSPTTPVLAHGTNAEFTEFKEGAPKKDMMFSFGFHFTDSDELASNYGKRIVRARLNLKNPLDVEKVISEGDPEWVWLKKLNPKLRGFPMDGKESVYFRNALDELPPKKVKQALLDAGYDGLIYHAKLEENDVGGRRLIAEGKTYVALDPNQIIIDAPSPVTPQPDATQERQVTQDDQQQREQAPQGGTPVETGGRDQPVEGGQVAEGEVAPARVILSKNAPGVPPEGSVHLPMTIGGRGMSYTTVSPLSELRDRVDRIIERMSPDERAETRTPKAGKEKKRFRAGIEWAMENIQGKTLEETEKFFSVIRAKEREAKGKATDAQRYRGATQRDRSMAEGNVDFWAGAGVVATAIDPSPLPLVMDMDDVAEANRSAYISGLNQSFALEGDRVVVKNTPPRIPWLRAKAEAYAAARKSDLPVEERQKLETSIDRNSSRDVDELVSLLGQAGVDVPSKLLPAPPPVVVAETPPPTTPETLTALQAVSDNTATDEQVAPLIEQGLVEEIDGQRVITEAGVAMMPEPPRLTPDERRAEIAETQRRSTPPPVGPTAEAATRTTPQGKDNYTLEETTEADGTKTTTVGPPPTSDPDFSGDFDPEKSPTGIRHAATEAERARLGLPPRVPVMSESNQSLWNKALKAEDNYNGPTSAGTELLDRVLGNPKYVPSDEENALLALEQVARLNQVDAANRALSEAPDNASAETLQNLRMVQAEAQMAVEQILTYMERAGSQAGKALQSRRLVVNRDFSLGTIVYEMKAAKRKLADGPVEWTDADQAKAELRSKQLQEAQEEVDRLKSEHQEALEAIDALNSEVASLRKEASRQNSFLQKQVRNRLKPKVDAARARLIERGYLGGKGAPPTEGGDTAMMSGLSPELAQDIQDIAMVATDWVLEKTVDLGEFTKRVVAAFGEKMRPHSKRIHDLAKKFADTEAAKARDGVALDVEQVLGSVSPDSEITTKLVTDLAKAHMLADPDLRGTKILDAVHATLRETFPYVTRDKVAEEFTNYGRTRRASQDKLAKKLRQAKELERLQLQIIGLEKDQFPKKTGYQRDETTPEARQKQKKINDLKKQLEAKARELGWEIPEDANRQKTSLEAIKRRLENEIQELDNALASKEPIVRVKRGGVEYDEDANNLKAERDAKRRAYDEMFRTERTEEERLARSEAALDRLIAEEEQKLANEEAIGYKEGAPTSPAIEAKRERLSELRRLRREISPGLSAKDQAARRVAKSVLALTKELETGERQVKAKKQPDIDAELRAFMDVRDALRDEVMERRRALPETPEQEQARERRQLEQAEATLARVEAKLRSGDLSVNTKKGKPVSARVQRVRNKIKEANRELAKRRRENEPEEVTERRKLAAIQRQKAEYLRRIREKDYSPMHKEPKQVMTEALAVAQLDLALIKREYAKDKLEMSYSTASFGTKAWHKTRIGTYAMKGVKLGGDFGVFLRQIIGGVTIAVTEDMMRVLPGKVGRNARARKSKLKSMIVGAVKSIRDPNFETKDYLDIKSSPNAGYDNLMNLKYQDPFDTIDTTTEDLPVGDVLDKIPWWVYPVLTSTAAGTAFLIGIPMVTPAVAIATVGLSFFNKPILKALDRGQRVATNRARADLRDAYIASMPFDEIPERDAVAAGRWIMMATGSANPKSLEKLMPTAQVFLNAPRWYVSIAQNITFYQLWQDLPGAGSAGISAAGRAFKSAEKGTRLASARRAASAAAKAKMMDAETRKWIAAGTAKSAFSTSLFLTTMAMIYGIADEDDPESEGLVVDGASKDFGSVRTADGKIKFDLLSGRNSWAATIYRVGRGLYRQENPNIEDYGQLKAMTPQEKANEIKKFIGYKRSVAVGYAWDTMKGEYFGGKPRNLATAIEELSQMIILNDIVQVWDLAESKEEAAFVSSLMFLGGTVRGGDYEAEKLKWEPIKAEIEADRKIREAELNAR